MKKSNLLMPVLAVATAATFLSGCVVRETRYRYASPPPDMYAQPPPPPPGGGAVEIEVNAPPPPPPAPDVITVSPGPEFLWIPGVWMWEGRWVWHGGHYGHRPRAGVRWYGPHYVYRGGRHIYIGGGWR